MRTTSLPPIRHDMFRVGGDLGVVAHDILRHLDDHDGMKPKQLAVVTGHRVDAIRTKLRRMLFLGIAHRDDDGLWTVLPFDPDEVARAIGTDGKATRQRNRLLAEAALRHLSVETWKAAQRPEPTIGQPPRAATHEPN